MPSHAQERAADGADGRRQGRLPWLAGPRRSPGPARRLLDVGADGASQPPLMTSAIAYCSSSVGKTAAS